MPGFPYPVVGQRLLPPPQPLPQPPPHAPVKPLALSLKPVIQQASPSVETGQQELTILLSRVALGNVTHGSSELRRPPEGSDSTSHVHSTGRDRSVDSKPEVYCVYDNAQAYPEYIITYKGAKGHSRY